MVVALVVVGEGRLNTSRRDALLLACVDVCVLYLEVAALVGDRGRSRLLALVRQVEVEVPRHFQ